MECIHNMECIVASDKVPKEARWSKYEQCVEGKRKKNKKKWEGVLSISYVLQTTRDAETHSAGDPPEGPTFSSSNISHPLPPHPAHAHTSRSVRSCHDGHMSLFLSRSMLFLRAQSREGSPFSSVLARLAKHPCLDRSRDRRLGKEKCAVRRWSDTWPEGVDVRIARKVDHYG